MIDRQRTRAQPGIRAMACLGAALALAACSPPPADTAAAPDVVRPALIETVGQSVVVDKLRFPGRLRAAKRAELSFNVPGFVAEFALTEGSRVQAGQVLARLDDAVFKARLSAAQSEYERARIDLERYQRLWETEQAVARSEVDDRRSRLEAARTNLAAAQQDLDDTRIKAPFAGVITRRRLETFSNVQAKQAIAELQDLSALEVVINVPQRVLSRQGGRTRGVAVFEEHNNLSVPVVLKSYATEADPQTQTYEVVLALSSRPAGLLLLPGMSVTVLPSADAPAAPAGLTLPLTAVATDAQGGQFAWVVGADGAVQRANLVLGPINGARVAVVSGLSAGQRIVGAGVSGLRDGMKVRPLDVR